MSLKPESIFSSRLSQFVGILCSAVLATTWVNSKFSSIENTQRQLMEGQEELKKAVKSEVVTWDQAKLYAAKLDGANKHINLVVPEPNQVR